MKLHGFLAQTLLAAGCSGAALAAIIADAELPKLPAIDFGNMTATAILGWYAWHTTTRTIPQLVSEFRHELQEVRETFRQEMQSERETHRAEVQHLREIGAGNQRAS